jgi:hypothetical protein
VLSAPEEDIMANTEQQNATYAVIGYVPDEVAKSLGTGGSGASGASGGYGKALELRIKRGSDQEIVRVQPDHIAGILHGASQGGETGVQVFLKEKATVETVSRGIASDLHLKGISDPSVWWHQPPIVVIFAPPQNPRFGELINQLQQLKA